MIRTENKTTLLEGCDWANWTDEELFQEYRYTQQRGAFEELVRRYERELFNYLRHSLGSVHGAEDVFQLTFMKVHTKCELFEEGRKFRPWLYQIAMNQAIDYRRRGRKHSAVSIDGTFNADPDSAKVADFLAGNEPEPDADSLNEEMTVQVRQAIEKLPEGLRQVLYMVYFQGLTYREAADSLGIPFGTVTSRLVTAIKKLNGLLKQSI